MSSTPNDGKRRVKGANGDSVVLPAGDWYINAKARPRRLMKASLSSCARRVYACLELATMGFSQEPAVTMDKGEERPLTPDDITRQTGLSRQHVRSALEELESAGLGRRTADDDKGLRKGHVRIYSWTEPRQPTEEGFVAARGCPPEWFPESWEPFKRLIARSRLNVTIDEVAARSYKDEGDEIARSYKNAEEAATRFLETICAKRKKAGPSLYERNRKERSERNSSSASIPVADAVLPEQAGDEDPPTYATFKHLYPSERFDEPAANPLSRT